MNSKDFLYFYRILNWKDKISGVRPIGYTFLGYLMAGTFYFLPLFFNTLAILGALIFCYTINDYFDWRFQKENNFLAEKIKRNELNKKEVIFLCFLPLLLFIPFFLITSKISLLLFLGGFVLILFYSLLPFRFKKRKFFGFIVPPVGVVFLFLQGYSVLGLFNLNIFLLAIIIFLFQCYLEAFHVLDDSTIKAETKKIKNTKQVLMLIKILPIISLMFSLIFSFFNPIFLITSFFSLIRFMVIRKFNIIKNIKKIRKDIFSLSWSLYEFAVYSIFGIFHLF